jgi:hypothetical protein
VASQPSLFYQTRVLLGGLKASGGGKLPVKPRQIMYAARGYIQQQTGKRLDDRYFCQTILPDYCTINSDLTATWDILRPTVERDTS